jgi:hypothetical protein
MCFAEMIALERTDISQTHHSSSAALASSDATVSFSSSHSVSSVCAVNESEVVINSAVTLCGVAAKKAQESSGQKTERNTKRFGRMNFANTEPQLSDITPFALSSELLRLTVLTCGGMSLGKAIDLLNSCELVIDVHKRLEGQSSSSVSGSFGSQVLATTGTETPSSSAKFPYPMSALKQTHSWNYSSLPDTEGAGVGTGGERGHGQDSVTLQQLQLQISGIHFAKDGILMSASLIWGPLLRYILMETKRREGAGAAAGTGGEGRAADLPEDIEKLVTTLQRSENHLLAARVILSTWSAYQGKKQVQSFPSLLSPPSIISPSLICALSSRSHHISLPPPFPDSPSSRP